MGTERQIRQFPGGHHLLSKHRGMNNLLQKAFPEREWSNNNRTPARPGFWDERTNQRQFMDELAKKLNINSLDDWRSVRYAQLHLHGAGSILARYGSFFELLQNVYPEHDWQIYRGSRVPFGYW